MDIKDYFCSDKLIDFAKFVKISNSKINVMDIIEAPHKWKPEIIIYEKFLADQQAVDFFMETGYPPDNYITELR